MKHMDSIDKIVLAISPETQQLTAYYEDGKTQPILGQTSIPLYRPVNNQGQVYTMIELKYTTFAHGQPVIEYQIDKKHFKSNPIQRALW